MAANSPSNGLLDESTSASIAWAPNLTHLEKKKQIDYWARNRPSELALLERPRGGTFAAIGRSCFKYDEMVIGIKGTNYETYVFLGERCYLELLCCLQKSLRCLEHPDDLLVCNTRKLERIDKAGVDQVIAVDLWTSNFVPFNALFCVNRAMYPGCLIEPEGGQIISHRTCKSNLPSRNQIGAIW